jgi:hypothetical protein
MKKKVLVSLASLSVLVFACKKDDDKSNAERILGKWNISASVWNEHYNGADHKDSTTFTTGAGYYNFINNAKVVMYNGSLDTLDYKFINDNQLVIDGDTNTIQSISDSQLKLYLKETLSSNYFYEEWDTFTK